MNGKGDSPRPKAVDADTFAARWARTFGEQMRKIQDDNEALEQADPLYAAFIRQVGS